MLVVTTWYPTPDEPFIVPFIKDHLAAWTAYLLEDDGTPVAVVHPQEALSVFSALRHRQSRFNIVADEEKWRVVHAQVWRLARRWSRRDIARETQSVVKSLKHFSWLKAQPPRYLRYQRSKSPN